MSTPAITPPNPRNVPSPIKTLLRDLAVGTIGSMISVGALGVIATVWSQISDAASKNPALFIFQASSVLLAVAGLGAGFLAFRSKKEFDAVRVDLPVFDPETTSAEDLKKLLTEHYALIGSRNYKKKVVGSAKKTAAWTVGALVILVLLAIGVILFAPTFFTI